MLLISFYGLTVVTSFVSEAQLDRKLHNRFYEDRYTVKVKSKSDQIKDIFKLIGQLLIPGYNVVSSVYHLNNFDKYYEKTKKKLIKQNYLEKIEVKPIEEELVVDDTKVSESSKGFSNQDKIIVLGEEKTKLLGTYENTEYVKPKTLTKKIR